jgi:hypothetical protein
MKAAMTVAKEAMAQNIACYWGFIIQVRET